MEETNKASLINDVDHLPPFLRPYFWDTNFDALRLPRYEFYCIERLLEYGDDRAIRWLCKSFQREQLADVIRKSRAISLRTANFWGLLLNIPRGEMRCFSTPSLLKHGSFSRP